MLQEWLNDWKKEFSECLNVIEDIIGLNGYVCGKVLTFGDIVIFNEVSLYMALLGYSPDSDEMKNYPNIL